jgi:hypothetical protein
MINLRNIKAENCKRGEILKQRNAEKYLSGDISKQRIFEAEKY